MKLKRVAGPYTRVPFDHYIQSPVSLVPKDGGTKTRLIFHLSYPRGTDRSVNANIDDELCTVQYPSVDEAVRLCLREGARCFVGKSDMTSAFRHLCLALKCWKYLVMKAQSPIDGKWYFFIDKCLPFGAAISCSLFQKFSDAISYLVYWKTGKENINYLDDYFFADLYKRWCNQQIQIFLNICTDINFPVALDKTYWACTSLSFLGLLIDAVNQWVGIPVDKIIKAKNLIVRILSRKRARATLHELQSICGFLNFLAKAVVPGHTFTRRLYAAQMRKLNLTTKNICTSILQLT